MALLYPDLLRSRITDITVEDLHTLGVRGLLLDVDNTLTTHGSQELDDRVKEWLAMMKREGFAMTIVSNARDARVKPFAERVDLRHISLACKPLPLGFWRGARRLGLPINECAAVGDQTFTDMLGARLAGVHAIQLLPILSEHSWSFRLKRRLEKRILQRYSDKMKR